MTKARLLKTDKFYILFLIISILLSLLWFREGKIIGTAEEGLPFYDPARTTRLYSSIWWEAVGPGTAISVSPLWAGTFWLASVLYLFLPNFVAQALFYAFFFFSGMSGMYLLTNHFTKNKTISLIASVFYLFNLYTMSQVWFRALYVNMFVWAYFPLYVFLVKSWLGKGKRLFLLLLSTFVYMYTFSHPGYLVLFGTVLFLILIYYVFKNQKEKPVYIKRLLLFSGLFIILHIWWIYPMAKLLDDTFSASSVTSSMHYLALEGVSQSFPLQEILLLRERYYLGNWFDGWYKSGLAVAPSFLILGFVLYGWFKSKKLATKGLLTFFLVVGLFLSKGINPPLGWVFYKVLYKLPFVGAVRNPYEKLGLIFLVPYCIFFACGIFYFFKKHKDVKYRLLLIGFLVFIFSIFSWPYWKGNVYPEYAYVKVPDYYEDVNKILNEDKSESRVLVLPLVPDHGITFKWGYSGVEPSRFLFDKSSISVGGGPSGAKYKEMFEVINEGKNINTFLDDFNIGYIIVRDDLGSTASQATQKDATRDALASTRNLENIGRFGDVELFRYVKTLGLFQVIDGGGVDLNYLRVSPTKYVVRVNKVRSPFKLVFMENYNRNWIARVGQQIQGNHTIEYGYANSWNIQKEGNFEIEVVFKIWPWD